MEADLRLKILIQDITATGYTRELEFYSALFDGLVQLRAPGFSAESEDRCEVRLREVSDELYQIAITRRWLKPVKTRPYKIYLRQVYGDETDRLNQESLRGVYRLPTSEDLWNCLRQRVAHWTADFLKRHKLRLDTEQNIQSHHMEQRLRGARRGPKPGVPHNEIAAVIRKHGERWRTDEALESICNELQALGFALPVARSKWPKVPRRWLRALETRKGNVVKHFEYCLKKALTS